MQKMNTTAAGTVGNSWHHFNDSDTVFIFVHGFLSSSASCWTHQGPEESDQPIFWPDMILGDHRLQNPSIYLGGFFTAKNSGDYGIADCANELFDALQREDTEHRQPPLSKKNIVFICHSLGGIVTRYMLSENFEFFAEKHIGLVLLASPSLGSGLANVASRFVSGYGNAVLKQLKHEAPLLEELDRKFKLLIRTHKIPNLIGAEAYENQPVVQIWPLSKILGKVVEKNSAGRYFESKNMPGTNHSSISKPCSMEHPTHKFLVDFYTRPFSSHIQNTHQSYPNKFEISSRKIPAEPPKKHNEREVLFTRYSPELEPYFLSRPIDTKVSALLPVSGLWISGPSGVGKTCSVTRAIHQANAKFLYINLANCLGSTVNRMFEEILGCINQHFHKIEPITYPADLTATISEIVDVLDKNLTENGFHIFVEEIPIDDTPSFSSFIQATMSLLISCAGTKNGSRARFLFSSIASPTPHISAVQQKIYETVKFFEFKNWTGTDIDRLTAHLGSFLGLEIDNDFSEEIKKHAQGSPRFVKSFLLNYHVACQCGTPSYLSILAETSRELGK